MVGPFSEEATAAAAARTLLAFSTSSRMEDLVFFVVWETTSSASRVSICLLFSDFTGAVFAVLAPIVVFLKAMGGFLLSEATKAL